MAGRRVTDRGERAEVLVSIRLTPTEKADLHERARAAGLTVTDYLKRALAKAS